ncbi:MAG: glutaredoxin family protein [Brevibacillus sp.]|nr:glutaredoxin family protein [Brevibacillus sp.]
MTLPKDTTFHIVLYGRPGCHLCEVVKERIHAAASEFPLVIEERSIVGDPVLEEKYLFTIPVVEIDGDEVFVSIDSIMSEEQLREELMRRLGVRG